MDESKAIWLDGELVAWEDAKIHVLTHGLHYGTGVFEGIRAYETAKGLAVFRLGAHIDRLINSAGLVMLELPYSRDELFEATLAVVREDGFLHGCYIRPIVFLGYGELGVYPGGCPVRVAIAAWEWGAYLGTEAAQEGVRVRVSPWRRVSSSAIPTAAKACGTYLNSVLAKIDAIRNGYDEAVLLGEGEQVVEGSGENLFIVKEGRLITPDPDESGALKGITADSVMVIAKYLGYNVSFGGISVSDLYQADEAFLSGTAAEIVPIREVDDHKVGIGRPGDITRSIQNAFRAVVAGEDERYEEWLDYI
jgi:branched-chain amino acid aminotransferase